MKQALKNIKVEVTDELQGTVECTGYFECADGVIEGKIWAAWEISPDSDIIFSSLRLTAPRDFRLVPLQESDYAQLRTEIEDYCQRGGNLKPPF